MTMEIGGSFSLVDHYGKAVTDVDYHGRHVIVFFGFTHCKVVCPRALSRLTRILEALGPLSDRLTPLYVTVDPDRDDPARMRAFLERDYPRFTGLTGTPEQIEHAKTAYRVFAERKPDPDDPEDYQVPHTAMTYVMGPDGNYVTHFNDALDEALVTSRLTAILEDA